MTAKHTRVKEGKKQNVTGLVYVTVVGGRRQYNTTKKGWEQHPEMELEEETEEEEGEVGMLQNWPGTTGVHASFHASGRNYGDVGFLVVTNTTNESVTVTVPPGLLLDSLDEGTQDIYIADVPTEEDCEGAKYIDKPVTIEPNSSFAMQNMPGFCPDFELDPPKAGDQTVYTTKKPDEKSKELLATIEAVEKFDVGTMKLKTFEEDKAREMLAQGSLWMVDSRVDEVKGNEVTEATLTERYWKTFSTSAEVKLSKMSAKDRKKAEEIVQDDLKNIVASTSFIAKKHSKAEK